MIQGRRDKQNGFTIVELLIVIVVIAILAAVSFVAYTNISNRAIDASLRSDLTQSAKRLGTHKTANGSLPDAINCPADDSTEICLQLSGDNMVEYYARSTVNPDQFTLSITNGNTTYMVESGGSPVNASLVSSGLRSRYDASNPSSYQPGATTWIDLAGSNNASLVNTTYASTGGRTELIFDGSDSYVSLPIVPTQSIFIVMYINSIQSAGDYVLDARPGNPYGYIYTSPGGNWENFSADTVAVASNYNAIPKDQWIGFYAQTAEQYNTQMRLMSRSSASGRLEGRIGAVHIYDRQLTQAEVEQNYNFYKAKYDL